MLASQELSQLLVDALHDLDHARLATWVAQQALLTSSLQEMVRIILPRLCRHWDAIAAHVRLIGHEEWYFAKGNPITHPFLRLEMDLNNCEVEIHKQGIRLPILVGPKAIGDILLLFRRPILPEHQKRLDQETLLSIAHSLGAVHTREQEKIAIRNSTRLVDHIQAALNLSTMLAITDHRGFITFVNDQFCKLTGYTRQELLDKHYAFLDKEQRSGALWADIWQSVSAGQSWQGQVSSQTKNGSYFATLLTITPCLDEQKTPYQYIIIPQTFSSLPITVGSST